jgi:hypothetical protein
MCKYIFSPVESLNYKRHQVFREKDSLGRYGNMQYWLDNYFPGHPDGEHKIRLRAQVFNSALPVY